MFDLKGHTALVTGSTSGVGRAIARAFAKAGADLIIHSVAVIGAKLLKKSKIMRNILAHHSEPEDTAKVFNAIKPKLAIYSHVVMYGGLKPKDILSRVRAKYSGAVRMGKDLMAINVGHGKVAVGK